MKWTKNWMKFFMTGLTRKKVYIFIISIIMLFVLEIKPMWSERNAHSFIVSVQYSSYKILNSYIRSYFLVYIFFLGKFLLWFFISFTSSFIQVLIYRRIVWSTVWWNGFQWLRESISLLRFYTVLSVYKYML